MARALCSLLAGARSTRGLPTRFLDWTYNSSVAAYFAAYDATTRSDARLGVWAFDTRKLDRRTRTGREVMLDPIMPHAPYFLRTRPKEAIIHPELQLVTAPYAGNHYLRAQRGVFLLHQPQWITPESSFPIEPLSELLGDDALVLFSLPAREAPELLRLLADEGVNASRIRPDYSGIAEALKAQR